MLIIIHPIKNFTFSSSYFGLYMFNMMTRLKPNNEKSPNRKTSTYMIHFHLINGIYPNVLHKITFSDTHTQSLFQCMNSSFSPSLYLCLVITWNPKTKRQTNAHKNAKYHKIYFVLMNYHRKSRQKSRFINSQSTKAHLCPKTHKQTRAYTVWFKANPYLKIKRTFHS